VTGARPGLWRPDAVEMHYAMARGETDAVEILEQCLDRINSINGRLNAIVHLDVDGARRAAAASVLRAHAGKRISPLDGIPVTVKDNIFVGGMPATWGSRLYKDFVPAQDDIAVERLRHAGAVILGKTNTPEFALAARTDNALFGATRNPWDLALNPGGSSGGAVAAVAAGMAPLALATDAGGSTRLPASFTGLVGLRPSNGGIARRYGFPAMALDFQVVGLLARTVAELRLMHQVVAGPDARDPVSMRLERHTLGTTGPQRIRLVMSVANEPVDPQVRARVNEGVQHLAALGHQVEIGPAPYDLALLRRIWGLLPAVGAARAATEFVDWEHQVSEGIAAQVRTGLATSSLDYLRAIDQLMELRAQVEEAWTFDVLITPTSAAPAWPVGRLFPEHIDGRPGTVRSASVFATWVNACGYPAITLPTEPAADGRPIGLQIVAQTGQDALLLDLAAQFERIAPWGHRWPALD
jgi:aspartyl-tRNA(Asn)/glutamyl-tRNA(Gln) amidotransferase subunit A